MNDPLRLLASAGITLAVLGFLPSTSQPDQRGAAVRAIVLGIAQDGGVPHIGCRQDLCTEARRDPARRERVANLS